MGPILSMTYGLAVMKKNIVLRGMRNEVVGVLISLMVGFAIGLASSRIYGSEYRSSEMVSRGNYLGCW